MPTENQSTPRERPILFSGPMVRAILEGRKTVTRRALKIQPRNHNHQEYEGLQNNPPAYFDTGDNDWACRICGEGVGPSGKSLYRCPYGQPGDRLWVRETWQGPLVPSEEMEADPE